MSLYKALIRPLLFLMDPEDAHKLAHEVIKSKLLGERGYDHSALHLRFLGNRLSNPIGLAAGFDKNGELISNIHQLGFGFAEIGSVTRNPHEGNPRPRMFRLPKTKSLVNRMGLNSKGVSYVHNQLVNNWQRKLPIAINIARTNTPGMTEMQAIDDVLATFLVMQQHKPLYFALNLSCPNASGDVDKEVDYINRLLAEVALKWTEATPILLKLSPDWTLNSLRKVINVATDHGVSGFICGNTTKVTMTNNSIIYGGESGRSLLDKNQELVMHTARMKQPRQVIVGCGGISNVHDVVNYLKMGADVVQLYSALVYEGPDLVGNICQELAAYQTKALAQTLKG